MSEFPGVGERVYYTVATKAQRQATARAVAARPKLSVGSWKALAAVWCFTTTFSKLAAAEPLPDLARKAGLSKDRMSAALGRLTSAGVIVHRPGLGRGNLTVVGVPPEGVKAAAWASSLFAAESSPFSDADEPEKPTLSGVKGDVTYTHVREDEKREEQPQRLRDEGTVGPEPSRRDHDHVLGETTAEATDRVLEAVNRVNSRAHGEDVHAVIERARQAQENEPVRFVIEPADAEAEQLVAEGVLVEVERRP